MDDRATAHERPTAILVLAVLIAVLLVAGFTGAAGAVPQSASVVLPEPVYGGPPADARAALGAPRPGSGGWYWPIGTENFRGWAGWLAPRGAYVHVAQDMPCAYGQAVYAIGDGVVYISRADAGGYGVGGAPGGCIIITHTTAAGTSFHALYGHVRSLKVKAGARVRAGQVIARVNGCRHLHFSIHPGAKYRDRNPYAGHVPKKWADHGGFVNPVKFLKTNPSAAAYRPPPLPRVEVATTRPPLQYGAAEGAAYWTEEGVAGSVRWRYDLASGERSVLAPGEIVPPYDAQRYEAEPLVEPALGFAVGDHLSAATLEARHRTPRWGASAVLAATLTNAAGEPLPGAILKLQRWDAGRWRNVRLNVTDRDGEAVFRHRPSGSTSLRVTFAPPAEQPEGAAYLPARSPSEVVTPHVALTTPRLPAVVGTGHLVTVAGNLVPHHPAGAHTVQLVFQRRGAAGTWITKRTVAAVNRDRDGGEVTRHVGHARLTTGSWRVRATHPADEEHAPTAGSWRTFAVK